MIREQTLIPLLYTPTRLYSIDSWVGANTQKAISCKYLSISTCTVVEDCTHGFFCLGYFSSPTHFPPRERAGSEGGVLVFAHDLGYRGGNFIGLLANTGLFSFHW